MVPSVGYAEVGLYTYPEVLRSIVRAFLLISAVVRSGRTELFDKALNSFEESYTHDFVKKFKTFDKATTILNCQFFHGNIAN